MPIEPHELHAIKLAAATAVAHHGHRFGLNDADVRDLASIILASIDDAATDSTDPRPFVTGRKVRVKGTGIGGVVVRTVETAGELHTVVVRLALDEGDVQPETPFGPRELEVIG